MLGDVDLQIISDLIQTVLLLGRRPIVQRQLAAFAAVTLLAWLLTDGLWHLRGQRLWRWVERRPGETRRRIWGYGLLLGQYVAFPILGVLTLIAANYIFMAQGWLAGLLETSILFFWVLLAYRLLIALLHVTFGKAFVDRHHYRFLAPLLFMLIIGWSLNNLTNLDKLAEVELLTWLANPITLRALFIATVGFYFWYTGAGLVHDILHFFITPRTRADPEAVDASLTIARYVVIAVGIYIAFKTLGLDSSTLAFISGGLSVGIGFGLKEIISNLISGILLLFDKSLRPGDIVSIDNTMGVVKELSVRATTVRTRDNVEIVVPNQIFFTSSVTTFTKSDRLIRILIPVGVSYNSDPKEVNEILLAVAQQHPLVQAEPEPAVYFANFGDSSLDFSLGVWLDNPLLIRQVTSELRFMIWEAFVEHKIEIPYPQQDLHIRSGVTWEKSGLNVPLKTGEPNFVASQET